MEIHNDTMFPENFHKVSPRISSGSEPRTTTHFAALKRAGFKTIISVDAARPEVELARSMGIRYIHLPIGYDDIPHEVQAALAKALNENSQKVFIHCHHGRHRGPAAAAIAGRILGHLDQSDSLRLLKDCGTSRDYPGLWHSVEVFSTENLGVTPSPLVEVASVEPLAASMSEIDRLFDRLKAISTGDWENTGLTATEPATLLHEHFVESARHAERSGTSAEMAERLSEAAHLTSNLMSAISTGDSSEFRAAVAAVRSDCRSCHQEFRN